MVLKIFSRTIKTNVKIIMVFTLLTISCGTSANMGDKKIPDVVSLYVGGSQGGFIENSDLDAVTGATNTDNSKEGNAGLNIFAGLHFQYCVNKWGSIESGIDIISHKQSLIYHEPDLGFDGRLGLDYYRFSIPITYNLGFIQNISNDPILKFKIGLSLNYIYKKHSEVTGVVPDFSIEKFALSPYFGLSIVPFSYKRYSFGVFFNTSLLKGSKVFYDKTFHKSANTGLLSTMELGCNISLKL